MVKITASLVLRNEADRYLASVLEWNSQWWDELFVYDDQSTDITLSICAEYTDKIVSRPNGITTFMEDEGAYRQAAWGAMIDTCNLSDGDWVFSLDADEFLVGGDDLYQELRGVVRACEASGSNAWAVPIPEVWDSAGPLRIRTDGFWGTMTLPRLTVIRPEWKFHNKKMGCGSTPSYSYANMFTNEPTLKLLHFGYARDEDRQVRSSRYLALRNHGHNPKHIKSILATPTLKTWEGQTPRFAYGS